MAISTVDVLHGVQNSSTFISQISNLRVSPQVQLIVPESAGLPYPLFVAGMNLNPDLSFDTTQLKTVLDLSGALTSIVDLSGANTDLYFKAVTDRGRRVADASASHNRFRMSQAWLSLASITAGHNQEASASVRIGTNWDGTNNPLIPAGSTALAGTPSSAEHWVAGPVLINTVALPGVQDITIEFNRRLLELGGDGELYNTFAACQAYAPVVTIRGYSLAWATYGLGTALTALTVNLRKVTTLGRVANATQEHIEFTASSGIITIDDTNSGANDPAMTTVRCTLVSSSASAEAIACDTTAAIA